MSNSAFKNEEPKKIVVTDAAGRPVTLHTMIFQMLATCRAVEARWALTIKEVVGPIPAKCEAVTTAADDLFATLGGFDDKSCEVFAELAQLKAHDNNTLGVTQSKLLNEWRQSFRTWRKAVADLCTALANAGEIHFLTVMDRPGWRPPELRAQGAAMLATELALRLKQLQGSIGVLDMEIRRQCPGLLVEIV